MHSENDYPDEKITALFLENNERYLRELRASRFGRLVFRLRPRLRRLYRAYCRASSPRERNQRCAEVLNAYEERFLWKAAKWRICFAEDLRLFLHHAGHRPVTDHSGRGVKDYYSVAVIVKNEARYIREFILFYRSTGADRIYLYDNDSTDDLPEKIAPFVRSGYVVYRKWPGTTVQNAAYRDALRRTRHRTVWLALIDADEYLFSPAGKTSDQLRAYESFPGVGVNWLLFGPGGHDRRPEGLVMRSYTWRIADERNVMNCHIKSIVQPRRVVCMFHAHYAIYRGKGYAVDEKREAIRNTFAFAGRAGRAFTLFNHRDVFRIHHYTTKSLEDLREKCRRGYPDGSPNAVFEEQLRAFETELVQDETIFPLSEQVEASLKA